MRFHPLRPSLPRARAAAPLLALLALPGCLFDIPTVQDGETDFAKAAFGADAVVWSTPDSVGGGGMQPELNGGHVYFERDLNIGPGGTVRAASQVLALDRGTGALLWHGQLTAAAENAAVAGGRVGAVWGSLAIFDPANGTRNHLYRFGTTSLATNVVSDGARFYVGSHDGHAIAVDPATGTAAWTTDLAPAGDATAFGVALEGDALAVGLKHFGSGSAPGDSGIVAVVERGTGAVRWRAAVTGARDPGIADPPVITHGLVIAATHSHHVYAFDLRTGEVRWRADASFTPQVYASSGLAACEGMVIVPTGDLGLVALDAATGAVRWRRGDLEEGSLRSVQCLHGTVLTLGAGLRVFDARTGAPRATYPIDEPAINRDFWINSATRDEQFLYVGTTVGFAKVRAP